MRSAPDRRAVIGFVRKHWCLGGVLAAYVVSTMMLPTLADMAIHDDWVYARSVETLVRDGRLEVLDPVAANLIAQTLWGSLFATVFGLSLGILRVSTIVMVGLGGVALYALARRLEVPPPLAALGTGAHLFFPLQHVITFSFMTDPHASALIIIATYLYVAGLGRKPARLPYVALGSVVAALAYLTRPQGLLVPAGVVAYLVLSRRFGSNLQSLRIFASVVSVPGVAVALHLWWLVFVNGVPAGGQTNFLSSLASMDASHLVRVAGITTVNVAAYVGLLTLPITLSALRSCREMVRTSDRLTFLTTFAWAVATGALYYIFYRARLMPLVASWMRAEGLGPLSAEIAAANNRAPVLGRTGRLVLTVASFASWIASAFLVLRYARMNRRSRSDNSRRSPAVSSFGGNRNHGSRIVGAIACFQALGVVVPALKVGFPWDRYLLPVLPLALALVLWAVREARVWTSVAWALVTISAFVAIVGTRNFLVIQSGAWDLARDAVQAGVPVTKLDAGAGWDGYWTYEQHHPPAQPVSPRPYQVWWLNLWGHAIDPIYVVSGGEIEGYRVVRKRSVSRWFREDYTIFLMHREGEPDYL